uniref:Uncharacterized protein n=1 Tax=Cyanothece sp. (strain PCC 7425 / ATCC 29141) TaxID=395961 RepID=B8HMV3_CYAP4
MTESWEEWLKKNPTYRGPIPPKKQPQNTGEGLGDAAGKAYKQPQQPSNAVTRNNSFQFGPQVGSATYRTENRPISWGNTSTSTNTTTRSSRPPKKKDKKVEPKNKAVAQQIGDTLGRMFANEQSQMAQTFAPKQNYTGTVKSLGAQILVDIGSGTVSAISLGGYFYVGQTVLVRFADGAFYIKGREGNL